MPTSHLPSPLRIAVLAGGSSAEREVSLRSGAAVAEALEVAGHAVNVFDPVTIALDQISWAEFDLAFIALHGGAGEDGRVQAELASLGVPFTGSDAEACRLAMSKVESKSRFRQCGVPTPSDVTIAAHQAIELASERAARLGFPLIVKPNAEGSSVGVSLARSRDELATALLSARAYDDTCIIEPFIVGREFTVAVLEDRALPTIEIVAPGQLFSYEAKYASSETKYCFDFELPSRERIEIERVALAATRALGTAGLARVDLMASKRGEIYVLEVNTIPGMTARSLAPLAASQAGLSMPELCDTIVRLPLAAIGV
jgi:D-alanine-D-alanine ligase